MFNELLLTVLVLAQAATEAAANGGLGEWASKLPLAVAGLGAALSIGFIGAKAAEATGRNPEASGKVLVISIIGMALAEAIAIYALLIAFQG